MNILFFLLPILIVPVAILAIQWYRHTEQSSGFNFNTFEFSPKVILVDGLCYFRKWEGERPVFVQEKTQAKPYSNPRTFLDDLKRIREIGFIVYSQEFYTATDGTKTQNSHGNSGNPFPGGENRQHYLRTAKEGNFQYTTGWPH